MWVMAGRVLLIQARYSAEVVAQLTPNELRALPTHLIQKNAVIHDGC